MNANQIEVTRDETTGRWTARIGQAAGEDEAGVAHEDDSPIAALSGLLTILHHGGHAFDFAWHPR
jgi:predicted secreted protein